MSKNLEEIQLSLALIFKKLESVEFKIVNQEKDIKAYISRHLTSVDSNALLIAWLKATRTSFELLRDEIDKLNGLRVALINEGNL